MAGLYIHVPYCKKRCIYCDFFTQTNLSSRLDYVSALCREIELRKAYLGDEIVNTIYFGGGTPSLLSEEDFEKIFKSIYSSFKVSDNAEITLEANPDDISKEYLNSLKRGFFNRLSMGVQSFDNLELKFLNRRHSAENAINAVKLAQSAGFDNISIDLMYGLPNQTMDVWKKNIEQVIDLNIQHISAYHLIYEEKTKLTNLLKRGEVKQVDEDISLEMFSTLIDMLSDAGFEHYEISNFAKSNLYSRHNTSYWQGVKYLGLGPAAHSFDGVRRSHNIASISKYIDGITKNELNIDEEDLDISARYNEFILTGMRTKWGIDLTRLEQEFGEEYLSYCLKNIQKYLDLEDVERVGDSLVLSRKGIFISDGIMSDLMWI